MLINRNGLDFDKFDTQVGCGGQSTNFDEDASCFRNGPQMNIVLGEGNDILSLRATNGLNGPVIFQAPVGESHVAGGRATTSSTATRGWTISMAASATTR